ncbi:hypothetical protein KY290_005467 [Solanum tuberosum]|uniref:Uncharacterized protein n=1 Tax=Solanum tuberosum TaxID=4113 RepID=A0ABQ7WGC7_SOLTU|nr:hypothetical protein KY290_005467 [Solanum tuberosum]
MKLSPSSLSGIKVADFNVEAETTQQGVVHTDEIDKIAKKIVSAPEEHGNIHVAIPFRAFRINWIKLRVENKSLQGKNVWPSKIRCQRPIQQQETERLQLDYTYVGMGVQWDNM